MSEDRNIIRASSLMALGTLISRVTGLIRGLLTVAVLGTALLGDTYNVGNTTPNIIYNLLIGGALTAVFVPQIVRAFRDPDGGSAFVSKLTSLIGTLIFIVTTVAMIAAPLLVSLYAPTFAGRARDITIAFTLFCLPQILFYGLFGVLGQITNAKERFGPMMWSPIANNLVVIGLFAYFLRISPDLTTSSITDREVMILGVGTTFGIALQAALLLPYIRRSGLELRVRFDWRGSGLGKSIRLGSWTLLSVLISQIGFLVTVNLATRSGLSALQSGVDYGVGYTPYANAYLIMMLPHSIATISIVTAVLPQLSKYVIDNDLASVRKSIQSSLRLVGIVTIPAALFFISFGDLVSQSLFFGIGDESATYLGKVLSAFALGLIPLSMNLVGIRALNAFENTKSQFISTLINNLLAISLSILSFNLLNPEDVVIALAWCFTISYWVSVLVTDFLLRRYARAWVLSGELPFYLRVFLVAGLALGLTKLGDAALSITGNISRLILVLLSAILLYLGFARLVRLREVGETIKVMLRR